MRFRLLAALPLDVKVRGITYHLEFVEVPISGMWQLRASYPDGHWICAFHGSQEGLRQAVYQHGVECDPAMKAMTIFEELVKDGRASRIGATWNPFPKAKRPWQRPK